jgi:hypothetical protein
MRASRPAVRRHLVGVASSASVVNIVAVDVLRGASCASPRRSGAVAVADADDDRARRTVR